MTEITIKQFIARAAFTSVMGSFVYLILFITSDSHWGIAEINFRTPFWAPSPQGHLQVLYFIIFDISAWVSILQWWFYFNFFCKPNFAVVHLNKANVSSQISSFEMRRSWSTSRRECRKVVEKRLPIIHHQPMVARTGDSSCQRRHPSTPPPLPVHSTPTLLFPLLFRWAVSLKHSTVRKSPL